MKKILLYACIANFLVISTGLYARTLLKAVKKGNLLQVEKLVENGADVNAKDNKGVTPLFLAAGHGFLPIVEYLGKNGADVKARDICGCTAIQMAVENGHTDIAGILFGINSMLMLQECYPIDTTDIILSSQNSGKKQ